MTKRNPWPTVLTAVLLLLVAAVVAFAAFSTTQRQDLVTPAYYAEEVRYQAQIDRQARAVAAGAVPRVEVQGPGRPLRLTFPAAAPLPEGGEVHLYRPADAGLDRRLPLVLAGRTQLVPTVGMAEGLWRLRLRWHARGEEYAAEQVVVLP